MILKNHEGDVLEIRILNAQTLQSVLEGTEGSPSRNPGMGSRIRSAGPQPSGHQPSDTAPQ